MRISDSCVNSEDIKFKAGADSIFFAYQEGYGPYLIKDNKEMGIIDFHNLYLGADIIVDRIRIYDDKDLSHSLTKEFRSKIIIFSRCRDKDIH